MAAEWAGADSRSSTKATGYMPRRAGSTAQPGGGPLKLCSLTVAVAAEALATVRYLVLEVTATVEPFENGRGFSLRVLRAGKPRLRPR